MSQPGKETGKLRRVRKRARVYFRRFRLVIWMIVLALLAFLIYLNQTGLPGFLKDPVLRKLNAQGIDLQFSRLRLRWYEGLVAEDVRFGRLTSEASPQLTAREAKVSLHWPSLLKGRAQVDSIIVRGGTFSWPVPDESERGRHLVVSNIQTELRLLPGDAWILDQFKASFARATVQLSASIDNASAARDWPFLKGAEKSSGTHRVRNRIKLIADTLNRIEFGEPPELVINVRGDAKDPRSFGARIDLNAPSARTPWGNLADGNAHIRLYPSKEGSDFAATVEVNAASGQTRWGSAENFQLVIDLAQPETITNSVQGVLHLSAARARTPWAAGADVSADVQWVHSLTKPIPLWASGSVSCSNTETRWAAAARAKLTATLSTTNTTAVAPSAEWGWWTNLAPFEVQWTCEASNVETPQVSVRQAMLAGDWAAPSFLVKSASVELYDGKLSATGSLDVDSRRAAVSASLDFDVKKAERVMTEGARRWISQYTWRKPPLVSASAAVTLPVWTNRQPDWRGEVLPSLWLSGQFEAGDGAGYKGFMADSASGHFIYSNMTWHLPDLVVRRSEGSIEAEHVASDRTREYYWKVHSTMDPAVIRPLLKTNETHVFELLQLSTPPEVTAEIRGRFHRYDLLSARAFVKATNFSFRGQSGTRLEAEVLYSNKVIEVINPRLERGKERAAADRVVVDFNKQMVFLTNAAGTADPLAIARAIGPKVGRTMEAYLFTRPPRSRAYGAIPMHGEMGADLHFDVDGGPFHWWKFKIPQISGHVHWKDYQLSLAIAKADFYRGTARGNAVFDLSDLPGTEFMFSMTGTNVLLQELLADLTTETNKSEGWLDGTVVVTRANSIDWRTVQGYGELKFHDGLLWDIPLFGILSPVLDGLMPGLGNSRATEGNCTYVLTNGVFRTADLDIRTMPMRLQYRGDVDLAREYQLKARVEAELLKDMWVVGPLVSTVLWPVTKLFEFKVDGTLGQPKLEPVNVIPKIISVPFYPFRVFKGAVPETQQKSETPPSQAPAQ